MLKFTLYIEPTDGGRNDSARGDSPALRLFTMALPILAKAMMSGVSPVDALRDFVKGFTGGERAHAAFEGEGIEEGDRVEVDGHMVENPSYVAPHYTPKGRVRRAGVGTPELTVAHDARTGVVRSVINGHAFVKVTIRGEEQLWKCPPEHVVVIARAA